MNQNKKVLQFVLLVTLSLLAISIFVLYTKNTSTPLQNISILTDILKKDSLKKEKIKIQKVDSSIAEKIISPFLTEDSTDSILQHFTTPNKLINFSSDTNSIVIENFIKKIIELKKTKKGKIRIAYLGDSMIEGDLVSQTLRKYLQKAFGGTGVGFIPITSPVAGFRITAKHSFSTKWRESNFKTKISYTPLYLSGKTFFAQGYNWVDIEDKTLAPNQSQLQKYLLCGFKNGNSQIAINSVFNSIKPSQQFNKILLNNSTSPKIKIEISDISLPLYGISFESTDGIIIDNFSFRGSGGFEFINIDSNFLKQINTTQPYDLVIMQYGVNVLNHPNNSNFNWYYKAMTTAINKLKKNLSNAEFLLISTADKSFKYSDGRRTAIGMDSLIATQERIAFDSKIAFFNTYNSMGGYNSMISWANGNPQLAAKDYTHLNSKGAEILGTSLFNGINFEIIKAESQKR